MVYILLETELKNAFFKEFKKISKKFQKKISKKFQKISKNFKKNFKKFQKNFKKFQKNFKKFQKNFKKKFQKIMIPKISQNFTVMNSNRAMKISTMIYSINYQFISIQQTVLSKK